VAGPWDGWAALCCGLRFFDRCTHGLPPRMMPPWACAKQCAQLGPAAPCRRGDLLRLTQCFGAVLCWGVLPFCVCSGPGGSAFATGRVCWQGSLPLACSAPSRSSAGGLLWLALLLDGSRWAPSGAAGRFCRRALAPGGGGLVGPVQPSAPGRWVMGWPCLGLGLVGGVRCVRPGLGTHGRRRPAAPRRLGRAACGCGAVGWCLAPAERRLVAGYSDVTLAWAACVGSAVVWLVTAWPRPGGAAAVGVLLCPGEPAAAV